MPNDKLTKLPFRAPVQIALDENDSIAKESVRVRKHLRRRQSVWLEIEKVATIRPNGCANRP